MGLNKLYIGETGEAVEWFRRADAIAPRDPDRWTWLQGLGRALIQLGQDAEAVNALSQAIDSNPGYFPCKAWLAAAEALAGNVDRARLRLAEYVAMDPGMTVRRFAEELSSLPLEATSAVYRRESQRILQGLRLAGMPYWTDAPCRGARRRSRLNPAVAHAAAPRPAVAKARNASTASKNTASLGMTCQTKAKKGIPKIAAEAGHKGGRHRDKR
jgi:tetratricopeptide (TPR) repeat protein